MSYEFNDQENKVVQGLARKLRLVSLVFIVLAILGGVQIALQLKGGIPFMDVANMVVVVLLVLLVGIWFFSSASGFAKIAKTEGDDMGNLMTALGGLSKIFGLIYWAILIAILATIAFIIYAAITGNSPV